MMNNLNNINLLEFLRKQSNDYLRELIIEINNNKTYDETSSVRLLIEEYSGVNEQFHINVIMLSPYIMQVLGERLNILPYDNK